MIKSLIELSEFTIALGDALPAIRESIVLLSPGCSANEIARIVESFPGMPSSYLEVVEKIDVVGKAIGYFQLAPNSYPGEGLPEKLVSCNSTVGLRDRFERDGVYQVASWDAEAICVCYRSGQFELGQIVKYSVGSPSHAAVVLADSYEQFLMLAGSLDQVREKYSEADDTTEGVEEFGRCLAAIAPNKNAWLEMANVVLL